MSPFKIVPKDKKILKSSKVRAYFKMINNIVEPEKQSIMDKADKAVVDAIIYGCSEMRVD